MITCDQDFCAEMNGGVVTGCKPNASCLYASTYADGSYSLGYLVEDVVQFDGVSGDLETKKASGSVVFGYVFLSINEVCNIRVSVSCYISLSGHVSFLCFCIAKLGMTLEVLN